MTVVEFTETSPLAITGGYDETDIAGMTGTKWEGILVVEGAETGDGREFVPNSITWAEMPLPLRRNIEDSHGGVPTTKAVLVGRIDAVWRDPDNPLQIRGRGVFDDAGEHGAEAVRLIKGKFLKGVSVDPDDIKDSDVELVFPDVDENASDEEQLMQMFATPEKTIFHAGRLRAATLCDIPAFVEAQIWLADEAAPATIVAAADSAHFGLLSDRPWHGPAQETRLRGNTTAAKLRQSFAHVRTGDAQTTSFSRFLHHEIDESGTVGPANVTAVLAAMRTINAGRASTLSSGERLAAYEHLAQHMRAAGLVPPPYEPGDVLVASSSPYPERPPRAWFENPQFTALTPLTITDDGHIFGHGAAWNSCHTSFADVCTTAPREGEHSYFRLGEVVTAEGDHIAVGTITLGTGHASTRGLTASKAVEHYDNTGTAVAFVASGEDEHGIWISGAIRPGTPEQRVTELRAAALSGDWRRIGGQLRLVAFLAVNHPGFPVPRLSTFVSKSQQLSLVASGVVTQDMRPAVVEDHSAIMARLARSIGRDPKSRLNELKSRVHKG